MKLLNIIIFSLFFLLCISECSSASIIYPPYGNISTFGDSLTNFSGIGYNQKIAGALPGWNVSNNGVSGNSVRDMINRYETDIVPLNPTYSIILGGTNDIWAYNHSAEQIESDLETLYQMHMHDGIIPVPVTIPPNNQYNAYKNNVLKNVNSWIREWSVSHNFYYSDLWSVVVDPANDSQYKPDSGYNLADGAHLDSVGYTAWVNNITSSYFKSKIYTTHINYNSNVANYIKNPALNGTYLNGVAPLWEMWGVCNLTENADPIYSEYGGKSQHVVAPSYSQGVHQSVTLPEANVPYTVKVHVYIKSGQIRSFAYNSNYSSISGAEYVSWGCGWKDVAFTVTPGSSGIQLFITSITGPAEFYIDYVQCVNGSTLYPSTNFNTDTHTGSFPLTVSFTDSSIDTTSLTWDFGDGNNSTVENPTHVYYIPGTYYINLNASNDNGYNIKNDTTPIAVSPCKFTLSKSQYTSPAKIQFIDSSYNPNTFRWDFENDGTIDSTDKNTSHTYWQQGNYSINLTINTVSGNYTMIQNITINNPTFWSNATTKLEWISTWLKTAYVSARIVV